MQQERSALLEAGTRRYQEWHQQVMAKAQASPQSWAQYEDLGESLDLWLSLVETRRKTGATCADVAKRAGLTEKQVRQFEQNGLDTVRVDVLKRYAMAVGKRLRMTLVEIESGQDRV